MVLQLLRNIQKNFSKEDTQVLYQAKLADMKGNYSKVDEDHLEDRANAVSRIEKTNIYSNEKKNNLKQIDEHFK